MKDKRYIEADFELIELTELTKRYPQFPWTKPPFSECAFCGLPGLPAMYLLCIMTHEKPIADYEPYDPDWRMVVFELRSMLNTNFEFPVCESHMFGEPQ